MTREEMVKRRWKPYEIINYQSEGMKFPAECLLTEIDFDAEILTLTPINDFYDQKQFPANLKYCSLPKMKTVVKDGQNIKDPKTNFIKAKRLGDGYFEDEEFDDAS